MNLLADANDAITSFSPYAALGANGVLVALCVWLITKHMPTRDKEDREARATADRMFTDQLREIREAFDRQLQSQRTQSADLAKSGHMAVQLLSESFHELALALSSEGTKLSPSGILRHREARDKAKPKRSESVLE